MKTHKEINDQVFDLFEQLPPNHRWNLLKALMNAYFPQLIRVTKHRPPATHKTVMSRQ